MNQIETLSAPTIPPLPDDKWRREQQAFSRLLPDLLKSHLGQYVAIHEGQVVESGMDKLDVAGRAYVRFGYVPIFVTLVADGPAAIVRIPSPRKISVEKCE